MSEKIYLAVLHKIGFTHKDFFKIFETKENFQFFYENLNYSLLKKYNFSEKRIEKILALKQQTSIEKIEKTIRDLDIQIIVYSEKNYPKNLKNIFNPPFLIYLRGNLVGNSLSFIGSRDITSYGTKVIETIVPVVGKYFSIVSGGALGCDTYAHKIALEHDIQTLSVFGTGIDIYYPASHTSIFENILKNGGGLISIFPLGEPGNPYNFPIRNEIVAGLSRGVVVVEAKLKSGSLITANLALDLGKDLFAVPGEIYKPNSLGCNSLISKGEAKAVIDAETILLEYNISSQSENKKTPVFNSSLEKEIYDTLLIEALNIDELSEKLDAGFDEIVLQISMMELSLVIKKGDMGKYEIF